MAAEFRAASYAQRSEQSLRRLIRERCYDAACLILSESTAGARGVHREPAFDLTFARFARSMCAQVPALYGVARDASQ